MEQIELALVNTRDAFDESLRSMGHRVDALETFFAELSAMDIKSGVNNTAAVRYY